MTKFVVEKNFFSIIQVFGTYFLDEIMNWNWGYLIHQGSSDDYIPSLVEEFYNSFTNIDIDHHTHRIHIYWRGEMKVVDLQFLLDLSGIPLSLGLNQIPMNLEE